MRKYGKGAMSINKKNLYYINILVKAKDDIEKSILEANDNFTLIYAPRSEMYEINKISNKREVINEYYDSFRKTMYEIEKHRLENKYRDIIQQEE